MIADDLLADIVAWSPSCAAAPAASDYLRHMAATSGSQSVAAITAYLTRQWVPLWSELAREIFGTTELEKTTICVVPSAAFSAETLTADREPIVVIHHGLMDLLSFAVECDLLSKRLMSLGDGSPSMDHMTHRFNDLARHLFHVFLHTPHRLPKLRLWLGSALSRIEKLFVAGAEIFVILHEIAHIRLNHLSADADSATDRNAIWHRRELEADTAAIDMIELGDSRHIDLMLTGAGNFLWWYTLYQAWTTNYPEFHPSAKIRFANLMRRAEPYASAQVKQLMNQELQSLTDIESHLDSQGRQDMWSGDFGTPDECREEMFRILRSSIR